MLYLLLYDSTFSVEELVAQVLPVLRHKFVAIGPPRLARAEDKERACVSRKYRAAHEDERREQRVEWDEGYHHYITYNYLVSPLSLGANKNAPTHARSVNAFSSFAIKRHVITLAVRRLSSCQHSAPAEKTPGSVRAQAYP